MNTLRNTFPGLVKGQSWVPWRLGRSKQLDLPCSLSPHNPPLVLGQGLSNNITVIVIWASTVSYSIST